MWAFFHGWRRQFGCITILMAFFALRSEAQMQVPDVSARDYRPPRFVLLDARTGIADASGSSNYGYEITTADFKHICDDATIKHLRLSHLWFDEEGLRVVAECPHIETLSIVGTNLSDNGVRLISKSKTIKKLHISSSVVSARMLGHVAEMKQLTSLSMYRCPLVASDAFQKFKRNHNDLEIDTDIPPHLRSAPE